MIEFSKMQGAGNDFVIVNIIQNNIGNLSEFAAKVCDRHFGIGADGFMAVDNSSIADIKMIFFNSDGSLATMCGNGVRCFAKYVYDKKIVNKPNFSVETAGGIKHIKVKNSDIKESIIKVDMGSWDFIPDNVPVKTNKDMFINEKVNVLDREFNISCVWMGVPHAVIIVDEIDENNTIKYGSIIEKLDIFPQKINVNFVKVVNDTNIEVDTWERGAGKTLACGTGACSATIVANKLNLIEKTANVKVAGGNLLIEIISEDNVNMEGKATFICDGKLY